MIIELAYVFFC